MNWIKFPKLLLVDYVVLVYQLFVVLVLVCNIEKIPNIKVQFITNTMICVVLLGARVISVQKEWLRLLLFFVPYLLISVNFGQLPYIIPYVRDADIDGMLIQWDLRLFKVHPTVFLERIHVPLLTEFLQLVYVSFYFLPIILIVRLYKKKKEKEYKHFFFVYMLGFYISYIGYFLFPSIGPRFTLQQFQAFPIEGVFLTQWLQNTLNKLEQINRDAFPSGHTMMTLLSTVYALRFDRLLGKIYIWVLLFMLFATVYLRYHYVVDVFGGIFFATFTILIVELPILLRKKD